MTYRLRRPHFQNETDPLRCRGNGETQFDKLEGEHHSRASLWPTVSPGKESGWNLTRVFIRLARHLLTVTLSRHCHSKLKPVSLLCRLGAVKFETETPVRRHPPPGTGSPFDFLFMDLPTKTHHGGRTSAGTETSMKGKLQRHFRRVAEL